jgi:hypothetical protein
MGNPLIDRITRAVPKTFWTDLKERQIPIYKQSLAISSAEDWSRVEALAVLPGNRRALFEHAMRQSAITAKLKPFDIPHLGDNSSCVTIKAAGLIIAGHFVDGPRQIPREAESRKQNAAVNRFITHHTDERLLLEPLPKFGNKPVYLNILHGGHFPSLKSDKLEIDPTTAFMRVGIPAQDCVKYLFNWSVEELLLEYAGKQDIGQQPEIADRAHPQRKIQQPEDPKRKNSNRGQ